MTRRSSVRAQAQEIYRAMAAEGASVSEATPTPNPSPQGGGEQAVLGAGEKSVPQAEEGISGERGGEQAVHGGGELTARVRALYEGSAVPVREIAALAGVTERTIYKYAAKWNWKPRYAWAHPRAPAFVQPRHPAALHKLRRQLRRQAKFAPVKGAGGRFIRRDDQGKPFAVGLKATDPAAAARAAAACAEAEALARKAQRDAEVDALFKRAYAAHARLMRTLNWITDYQDECKKKGVWLIPPDDPYAHALDVTLRATTDAWSMLQNEAFAAMNKP